MKISIIILAVILVFILWSIYNISEGFQTAPNTAPVETDINCSVLKGAYETVKKRYDDAVRNNNTPIIDSTKASMDTLKGVLSNNGC